MTPSDLLPMWGAAFSLGIGTALVFYVTGHVLGSASNYLSQSHGG